MSTLYNNKYDILASTIQPNPASVKYWADLSSNPNGGDLKYFNGNTWVLVNNKATEDISTLKQDVEDLKTNKGLSNYNDAEVRELIPALALRVGTLETDYEALEARVAALETPAA